MRTSVSGVSVTSPVGVAVVAAVTPTIASSSLTPAAVRAREVADGSGFCAEVMKVALDRSVPAALKKVYVVTAGDSWSLVVRDEKSSFRTIAQEDDFAAINEIAITLEKCSLTPDRVYSIQDVIDATKDEELRKTVAIQASQVLAEADRKLSNVIQTVVQNSVDIDGRRQQFVSIAGEHARFLPGMPNANNGVILPGVPANQDDHATYFDQVAYADLYETIATDAQVRGVERHERGLAAKKIDDFTIACEDVSETVDTMVAIAEATRVPVPAKKTRSMRKTQVFGVSKTKDTKDDMTAKVIAKHYAPGVSAFKATHARVVPAINTTNAQAAIVDSLLLHAVSEPASGLSEQIHRAMTATFANDKTELVEFITGNSGYRIGGIQA